MDKLSRNIELVANILIIAFVILMGTILVKNYLLPSKSNADQQQSLNQPQYSNQPQFIKPSQSMIGSQVDLSGVDFSQHSKTLILALQAGCHFCAESAPFYKRLIENVQDKNIKVVAVLPSNTDESIKYLKNLGINDLEVKQSSLNSLQVAGTPTLILANDKGVVINSWIGKLDSAKEDEMINNL